MSDKGFDELLRSFHKVNLTFVIPPFFSTVDESTITWTGNSEQKIMRCKPKKKKNKLIFTTHEDALDTVLIPTKHHPDCFWTDKSKKPFAVKLVMRHSQNRVTFPQAMLQLLQASPYKESTHVWIADNAFGSFESKNFLASTVRSLSQ